MVTFGLAVEKGLFDISESNFGQAPTRLVQTSQLDSVIFLSKNKALMITSEYCSEYDRFTDDTIEIYKSLWRAGRDTVYDHQLFSRRHSLDSIKTVLKTQYNFRSEIDNVVFIGYDNDKRAERKERKKGKKSSSIPVYDNGGIPPKGLLITVLALVSIFIASVAYKNSKNSALKNA